MILKLQRVSMHPWLWFFVVRPAVVRNTEGASLERRAASAACLRAIESKFDPDRPHIANPGVLVTTRQARERDEKNAQLEKQDPVGFEGHPDYVPRPNYLARFQLDFSAVEIGFLRESVEKFARASDVGNDMSQSILDAHEAISHSETVEVDTERKP